MKAFLEERLAFAVGEGWPRGPPLLDPGIGFGKTVDAQPRAAGPLGEIVALGPPVVVGTSRKTFLGTVAGGRGPGDIGCRARSPRT